MADDNEDENWKPKIKQLESDLVDTRRQLSEAVKKADNATKLLSKTQRKLDKANAYNDDLRQQIKDLSREIQVFRDNKRDVIHVSVQAVAEDILTEQGEKPLPQWNDAPVSTEENKEEVPSIADSLKQTAEAALAQSGFVFDDASGLYYDYNSGYYYNCEQGLYYDPASGTYFYYDESTGEYQFHSQVAPQQTTCKTSLSQQRKDETSASKLKARKRSRETKEKEKNNSDGKKKKKKRRSEKEESNHSHRHRSNKKRKKNKKDNKENTEWKSDDEDDIKEINSKDDRKKSKHAKKHKKDRKSKHSKRKDRKHECEDTVDNHNESDVEMGEIKDGEDRKRTTNSHSEGEIESDEENLKENEKMKTSLSEGELSNGSLATGESELESGELTSSGTDDTDSSSSESEDGEVTEEMDYPACPVAAVQEMEPELDDVSAGWPPCIRVMVTESDCLQPGSLFIVTCDGCTIGREKDMNHLIRIPDINVSKLHAEIKYDHDADSYIVVDCGSVNGTFLNDKCITSSTAEQSIRALSHGDTLKFGLTSLLLHIHPGTDTCDDCEPGQVLSKLQAQENANKEHVIMSKAERQKMQRKELKQIKKKYGLENSAYVNDSAALHDSGYEDKAATRRKTVGSDNPHVRDEAPASVTKPISTENKGRKLLAKMGWKEGEGLGKDNSGIAEPINVLLRTNQSAGLGSGSAIQKSLDDVHTVQRSQRWLQAQQRYNKLQAREQNNAKLDLSKPTNVSFAFKKGPTVNMAPKVDLGAEEEMEGEGGNS